ncbi:MAG: DUF177 domain-containing protein [Candidatus Omnitrophica bacterium]|nr:DUF177 domain-containing protein [Candidatus Omnitrophota bacterium]
MKVELSHITTDGICIEENLRPEGLGINTEEIKFILPLKAKAYLSRVRNVVLVEMELNSRFHTLCSRCLKDIELPLKRYLKLNYKVEEKQQYIDLDEDIREEIILSYPFKFLCNPHCRGLCPYCGKNLNEGRCNCI